MLRYSFLKNLGFFVSLAIALGAFSMVIAAPLTFRFEAEVTNSYNNDLFSLPFDYKVGDVIHGKMSFEPVVTTTLVDDPIASIQPYALEFEIDGTVIGTSVFGLKVLDNSAILDFLGSGDPVFDILTAGSSIEPQFPSSSPDPILFPGEDPFGLSIRLELIGESTIMNAGDLLLSESQLNNFMLRRTLSLGFHAIGSGSMGLEANVGVFTLVPEPTSSTLAAASCFLMSFSRLMVTRNFHLVV